jgi:hypothetical protein
MCVYIYRIVKRVSRARIISIYKLRYAHVVRFGVGELVDYSIVLFYACDG